MFVVANSEWNHTIFMQQYASVFPRTDGSTLVSYNTPLISDAENQLRFLGIPLNMTEVRALPDATLMRLMNLAILGNFALDSESQEATFAKIRADPVLGKLIRMDTTSTFRVTVFQCLLVIMTVGLGALWIVVQSKIGQLEESYKKKLATSGSDPTQNPTADGRIRMNVRL